MHRLELREVTRSRNRAVRRRAHKSQLSLCTILAAPGHPADKLDLRAPADRLSRGDALGDSGPDAASPAKPDAGDQPAGSRSRLSAPGKSPVQETSILALELSVTLLHL